MPTPSYRHLIETPDRDTLKESLQRRVAAKIVEFLPPDDISARRILFLAGQLYDDFVSVAACTAARAEAAE